MLEYKFRAELETWQNGTHFYGDTRHKDITEMVTTHEIDKREIVAPSDVNVRVKTDKFILTIHADAGFLDYDDEGRFYTSFFIGTTAYEFNVYFKEDGSIESAWVEEYFEIGYFENGDQPDEVYDTSDNTLEILTD